MGKFIDLTDKQFGRLTVLKKLDKRGTEWFWLCQCECGNTTEVRGVSLREGKTRSCGCLKKESDHTPKGNVNDLTGQKFHHLTVTERAGSDHRGEAKWACLCDCGNPTVLYVLGGNLRSGHTRSCGCDRRSRGEQRVTELLLEHNIPFQTEYGAFRYSSGYNAKFDFYVDNKYFIEYDGETHYKSNLHGWHNAEQLSSQQERDVIKDKWCLTNNIPLIRIPYTKLDTLGINDLLLETSQYIVSNKHE